LFVDLVDRQVTGNLNLPQMTPTRPSRNHIEDDF
jgi:hypothetical protein